jgi:RHS repeat-associated protein
VDYLQTQSGRSYVPKTPEIFSYDEDGNLTKDGRWSYTWDGENRLRAMETIAAAVSAGVPRQKLEYQYDYRGRRIWKKLWSSWNGAAYTASSETRFVYEEGWNLLAEIANSGTVIRRYHWGADLSGNREGAGGVGGLLAITSGNTSQLPFCDGNGNIVGTIDAATGQRTAEYEYGPFGEPLRATGSMVNVNPFRFSTKYTDRETGLVYYGYRYYNPSGGRWISRDPIMEYGGENLYGFVFNAPTKYIDLLGRAPADPGPFGNPPGEPYEGETRETESVGTHTVPGTFRVGREAEYRCKLAKAIDSDPDSYPRCIYECRYTRCLVGDCSGMEKLFRHVERRTTGDDGKRCPCAENLGAKVSVIQKRTNSFPYWPFVAPEWTDYKTKTTFEPLMTGQGQ